MCGIANSNCEASGWLWLKGEKTCKTPICSSILYRRNFKTLKSDSSIEYAILDN